MSYWNQRKIFKFGEFEIRHQACHRLGIRNLKSPLRCGFQICENGHVNDPFKTPQYALVYVLSGEGYYEDEQYGKLRVGPGSFVQRFPNIPHKLKLEGYSASFFVAMPAEAASMFRLTGAFASMKPVMDVGLLPMIVSHYLKMIDDLKAKRDEELMSVLIKVQEMVLGFHQLVKKQANPSQSILHEAASLLSRNFEEKIHLPDLAEKLKLSYATFRKNFQKEMGVPPGDFRIFKKIEFAQELLLEKYSVKETAAKLNYPDAYAFSRQFKKVTGVAPSFFLKMNK
ncbi:MAG: AraC family transcriptional regulator [Lentisphaeraceae bacterium]|nr:AraC family transcriptional regulator [Lentisphaeraceae bacterium]